MSLEVDQVPARLAWLESETRREQTRMDEYSAELALLEPELCKQYARIDELIAIRGRLDSEFPMASSSSAAAQGSAAGRELRIHLLGTIALDMPMAGDQPSPSAHTCSTCVESGEPFMHGGKSWRAVPLEPAAHIGRLVWNRGGGGTSPSPRAGSAAQIAGYGSVETRHCHHCRQPGHLRWSCPSGDPRAGSAAQIAAKPPRRHGYGFVEARRCHLCHQPGHLRQACPNAKQYKAGYLKAVWPDFLGLMSWGGSGGPRGPGKAFKNVGADAPHIFEGFPGSPGPPRPPP